MQLAFKITRMNQGYQDGIEYFIYGLDRSLTLVKLVETPYQLHIEVNKAAYFFNSIFVWGSSIFRFPLLFVFCLRRFKSQLRQLLVKVCKNLFRRHGWPQYNVNVVRVGHYLVRPVEQRIFEIYG